MIAMMRFGDDGGLNRVKNLKQKKQKLKLDYFIGIETHRKTTKNRIKQNKKKYPKSKTKNKQQQHTTNKTYKQKQCVRGRVGRTQLLEGLAGELVGEGEAVRGRRWLHVEGGGNLVRNGMVTRPESVTSTD